jgi:hypothetical protein
MKKCTSHSWVILAVVMATLLFTTAGLAQMPKSAWKKAAPFPEPDEELHGVGLQRQNVRDRRLGRRQIQIAIINGERANAPLKVAKTVAPYA